MPAADGYPGITGIGAVTAARLLNRHGIIENFPPEVLGDSRALALVFKDLATLRTDARLFNDVDVFGWRGPPAHSPRVRSIWETLSTGGSKKAEKLV